MASPPPSAPQASIVQVEILCLRECLRFSLRHFRYFVIFVLLYLHSLRHWRAAQPARLGYAFLQLFDDYMDGDRACAEPLEALAQRTRAEWGNGVFTGNDALTQFGRALHTALAHLPAAESATARADVGAVLEAMHHDYRRRTASLRLSTVALREQLLQTFRPSLNLLLICSRCRTRAADVPSVVEALCWCSVVRDFAEDMHKGIINVPAEFLPRAIPDRDILTHPQVQAWLRQERERGHALIEAGKAEVGFLVDKDPAAARLLGIFIRSMRKYLLS